MSALLITVLAVVAVAVAVLPVLLMSVHEHRRIHATVPARATLDSYGTRSSTKVRPASRIPVGDAEPIWRSWVEADPATASARPTRDLVSAR